MSVSRFPSSSFPERTDVQQQNVGESLKSHWDHLKMDAHVSISLSILLLDSFFPRDSFAKGKPNHATQGSSPTSDPSCHPSVSVRPCELSHHRRELQLSLFSTQRFIAHAFKLKHGELSTQSVHWLQKRINK